MNVNNEGLRHLQWQIVIYYTDDGKVELDVSFPQNQSVAKSDTRLPNSICCKKGKQTAENKNEKANLAFICRFYLYTKG